MTTKRWSAFVWSWQRLHGNIILHYLSEVLNASGLWHGPVDIGSWLTGSSGASARAVVAGSKGPQRWPGWWQCEEFPSFAGLAISGTCKVVNLSHATCPGFPTGGNWLVIHLFLLTLLIRECAVGLRCTPSVGSCAPSWKWRWGFVVSLHIFRTTVTNPFVVTKATSLRSLLCGKKPKPILASWH